MADASLSPVGFEEKLFDVRSDDGTHSQAADTAAKLRFIAASSRLNSFLSGEASLATRSTSAAEVNDGVPSFGDGAIDDVPSAVLARMFSSTTIEDQTVAADEVDGSRVVAVGSDGEEDASAGAADVAAVPAGEEEVARADPRRHWAADGGDFRLEVVKLVHAVRVRARRAGADDRESRSSKVREAVAFLRRPA
jgi:hypothetical protein